MKINCGGIQMSPALYTFRHNWVRSKKFSEGVYLVFKALEDRFNALEAYSDLLNFGIDGHEKRLTEMEALHYKDLPLRDHEYPEPEHSRQCKHCGRVQE
jgi:hypothetical protein